MSGCRIVSGPSALLVLALGVTATAQEQKGGGAPASVSQLEAAVRRDPGNPSAHVALGLAYWGRNEYPRALQAFRRAVEVGPRSAEAHNWLGVALSEKSDLPGAIAEFKKAIELDPQYGRAYANLGSALATSGDYAEAVEVFQKALALEPNSPGAHFNLGMALRETGNLEAALLHLRQVAGADPTNASIHYELGQTLRQRGDLAGAIVSLEKAIEINPELREGYYALGVALRQQGAASRRPRPEATSPADDLYQRANQAAGGGDLATAREELTEALRLDENHADAHSLLGFVLGQQRELSSALGHLERAVALRPESAEAHYNLGVALWYSGAKTRALAELRKCVELDPAGGGSQAFLGTALREMGDLAGARVSLQRAIALLPPSAAVYVDLAITYLRAGNLDKALGQLEAGLNLPGPWLPAPDWDSAIAALRKALVASPGRAEAHNVLGRLLGRQGIDSSKVAAEFREAIRLRPGFPEAHNNLGLVLIQAGDDPAGIAAFREAARIQPDYADAHANLGAALTPTDSEEAIRELEKAVALAPTLVKARFNLASAYGTSPTHGRAKEIAELRKVIELAPTFARAHLALGKALLQEGSVAEAIQPLQEAVRLEPERGEAHYQLGLALARAGRQAEATPELQKGRGLVAADERDQTASLDVAEGRSALERGDLEQAAAKLRHAIQVRPDSSEAQSSLGEVLEKQGNAEGASAAYRKALELNPADAPAREGLERLTNAAAASDDPRRVAEIEGYFREERFKEVEPLLDEYVKERPKSSWGFYALGYSRFAQKKIGDAIQALARSLELDVRNAEAHKILGRTLMIVGRFDAAQLEFEQAIRYKPDSAEVRYNLGKLFSIQDNWEPARREFEAALRLDSSYVEALDGLGFALEALGDDQGAIAHYEKAIAAERGATGPLRLRPREPERALQPRRQSGEGSRIRPQGARAQSQVRRRVVSEGQGGRAPGTPRGGRRRAPPGHLAQFPSLLVLLRAGRSLSPPRPGGRKPEGSRLLQAPRPRDERAGEDAAPRIPRQRGRPRAGRVSHRYPGRGPSRRGFLQMLGGSAAAALLPRSPLPRSLSMDAPPPALFTDVTAAAGLSHARNVSGRPEDKQLLLEEMGCGVALFDYDNDGWLDIFLVNGSSFDPKVRDANPRSYLFRNNRDGTFTDVTEKAGLTRSGWGQACCVGDYDNDGFDDLFVTYWGRNVLYHNNGDGTFTDVSEKAGVAGSGDRWGAGCCFLDYDRDGHLDLFVANYVKFDPARAPRPGSSAYCRYNDHSRPLRAARIRGRHQPPLPQPR